MNISIIIPTLHRPKDLEKTLNSFLDLSTLPLEIIIIDQSDDDMSKDMCKKNVYKKLNICYHHFSTKSGALARNLGIENINPKSDIVVFFDDDITVQKDFLDQIKNFFVKNTSAQGGMANIDNSSRKISFIKKIGIFLLTGTVDFTKTFVSKGGFNVLPLTQPTTLKKIERTMGCGMFFRTSIFDEGFLFERRFMRYSLMEDCFLSYAIQLKHPQSLYFVPTAKMTHYETPATRIANKSKIYQNIIHRFYFVQKFKKSTVAYLRTMLIFCIFDIMNFKDIHVIGRYLKGLRYVFTNKSRISNPDFDFNTFIFG